MKVAIFIFAIVFPLVALGATSTNYQLNQEGTGFTEFSASSANYQFKAVIGEVTNQISSSDNYIVDNKKTWGTDTVFDEVASVSLTGGGVTVTQTRASFSGTAYPLNSIILIKDGAIVASTIADSDGSFFISVYGINSGNHLFSIIAEDSRGLRSHPLHVSVTLSSGKTKHTSDLFLAPTLAVDKKIVRLGDHITISGHTLPQSTVTIAVASEHEILQTTDSDTDGIFSYDFDTTVLERGDHEVRAKVAKGNKVSEFGRTVTFEVGNRTVLSTDVACPPKGDLNGDCRVNLIDLSIAGFWYKTTLSPSFLEKEISILNGDGIINLTDLSILGFYWTG